MGLTFTFLGSGTSYGVPMIGCKCPVCTSKDPRDRRLRAAAWIHGDGISVIFDCGPDLREQAIRAGISEVDAVFLTHHHADHLNGIDDLRGFTSISRKSLPFYAQKTDIDFVRANFSYIFNDEAGLLGWGIPRLEPHVADSSPIDIKGHLFTPVPLEHSSSATSFGYRVNNFAYLTDCSAIPHDSFPLLKGIETVVIDGLRWRPHPTHFSIEGAVDALKPLSPKNIYLTHLTHDIMHAEDEQKLPEHVHLAYDTLSFKI